MHRIANVVLVSVRDVRGVLEGYVCCGMDGDGFYPALLRKIDHNLDQLKEQLDEEEFHAYNSKTCLAVLRKRFETFLSQAPWQTYSGYHNGYKDDVKHFQVYTGYEIQDNSGTKSKKQADSSRSGNHTHAEDGKISKDDAGIGNNVVGASHDKDNIIEYYVEFKNKEEIERFLKESKDGDKFCNDVVEVKEKLSKQIVQLEKDFAKLEAQSIAFEIALQHKTQENKSSKTVQKENEIFLASLQIENAHLKQTYKDLFESVQSSRIETAPCDEVKINFDMDKIETQNIELEHQVALLIKENEHLKLVYKNLFDSIKKPRVQKKKLRSTLSEFVIDHILDKDDSSPNSFAEINIYELEKESRENICENEKCKLQIKIVKLEKVLSQQTKDFDDVKLELSKRTTKFEAYFKKLKNTKVVLERKLSRKVDDYKLKMINF
ncbi:hypothetical protein Tco_1238724 [Tanacetum coccineum]